MTATTSAILETDRQAQWRERAEQGGKRLYRSQWAIHTLRDRLPPEHVGIAERLMELQAVVQGCRIIGQRVDHGGNRTEAQLARRLDAMRELAGLEAASRRAHKGAACFWALADGDSLESLMRRCMVPRGSRGLAIRLVQETLIAIDDYLSGNSTQVFVAEFDNVLDLKSKSWPKKSKVL